MRRDFDAWSKRNMGPAKYKVGATCGGDWDAVDRKRIDDRNTARSLIRAIERVQVIDSCLSSIGYWVLDDEIESRLSAIEGPLRDLDATLRKRAKI